MAEVAVGAQRYTDTGIDRGARAHGGGVALGGGVEARGSAETEDGLHHSLLVPALCASHRHAAR